MHRSKDCYDVLHDVVKERARQEELKAAGKFRRTCSDSTMSNAERYAVLGEECGEVGHEVNEEFDKVDCPGSADVHRARLRKELIQVAAVAVAWVEGLDGETETINNTQEKN